jgi:hypothetical protein
VQGDSLALGRVVDSRTIEALPLASQNFTQIVNLSPGVLLLHYYKPTVGVYLSK